eukprot:gnl/MRDRNA2_/MRDRNA2_93327_c0_seq1.p1 gnl/MRDRNA2_/MRDRNA2_93327_c0~~gnl/MRDRNA2_/MRDRNA2_93327_c0_seq1.p1  ORF type:complete len:191 (+),score=71.72 gnl/MRDRNA2_/MRDRNA2_93327_c0_seq1:81-653(+)
MALYLVALCAIVGTVQGKEELKPFIAARNGNKPLVHEKQQPTIDAKDPVLSGLRDELAELKRNQINVQQLEHTAVASKALLHESQEMRRVAVNLRSRHAYDQQVHDSVQVQKEATGLLQAGMAEATDEAREALQEATVVQSVAKSLAAEASAQLKMLAHDSPVAPLEATKSTAPTDDDDIDNEDSEEGTD